MRKKLFDGFWQLGSFDVQNAYICGCVKQVAVKRHYTAESRRNHSRVFYVNNGDVSVTICKMAFLRIHGISNGRLCRVLKGQQAFSGIPKRDERGRHMPGNKTAEEDLELVKRHIESFPSYESHYSRESNPHKKYLSPDLNITKMYLLYKEHCSETNKHPVSEWV